MGFERVNKSMKQEDDFFDRKNNRRKKIKNKFDKKGPVEDNDDRFLNRKIKNQIKQQKEHLEEEEWEDWDRYYNH